MSLNKFFYLKELKDIISRAKKDKKSIALANGGFDLIHIGHIRYLKEAKDTADILIVALNSDRSLRRLKGKNRPIIDEKGRIKILSSLAYVDYITTFNEETVDKLLLILQPEYHCKGTDYTSESVPERKSVELYGGKIAIVGGEKIRSTSDIIKKVQLIHPRS